MSVKWRIWELPGCVQRKQVEQPLLLRSVYNLQQEKHASSISEREAILAHLRKHFVNYEFASVISFSTTRKHGELGDYLNGIYTSKSTTNEECCKKWWRFRHNSHSKTLIKCIGFSVNMNNFMKKLVKEQKLYSPGVKMQRQLWYQLPLRICQKQVGDMVY